MASSSSSASSSQYKLSQQILGHEGDVRALATHTTPADSALVLSASRDKSACVWTRLPGSRNFEAPEFLAGHGGYVNSAAWLSDGMGGLFALTGGQDKLVNAFNVAVGLDGRAKTSSSPDYTLLGHQDNISALDVGPAGSYIVSGSWDKTARVWKGWQCVATFQGHLQAVWAVLAVDEDRVLTASADKLVRLWSISKPKEPIAVFSGHSDAVRGLTLLPGGQSFASCSNDGTINIYSLQALKGTNAPQRTLSGHTAFVYSLSTTPSGDLISSGEDRTLRIWTDGNLAQTITIPAISVWAVATFASGDLICGSSDFHIRVFTRNPRLTAPVQELEAYERTVASQSLNQTQVGDIRKDQLEGKEALAQPGNKEGQVKMIANGQLTEAYQWNSSAHKWDKVGEVVGGVGSGTKKLFEGKEYDYVFDVDIADDAPPLKLPYNLNENAYVAAQRFLERNELPMSYLDQVVSFIDKNTQGLNVGATEGYVDPYSGTGRYIPGASTSGPSAGAGPASNPGAAAATKPSFQILPQQGLLSFKQANLAALQGKLTELAPAGENIDISPTASALQTGSASVPLKVLQAAITSWPASSRFPLLDLYRLAAVHGTDISPSDFVASVLKASEWTTSEWPTSSADIKTRETNTMLAARAVANLFSSPSGSKYFSTPSDAVQCLASIHTTHFARFNKNGRVAYTTVLYNFSTIIASQKDSVHWAKDVLSGLTQVLTEEPGPDGEVIYRAMVALGNLLISASQGSLNVGDVQLAKDAAEEWGNRLGVQEERIKTIVADIRKVT